MQIQAFIPFLQQQLSFLYEPEEAKHIGFILLEEVMLIKRSHLPLIQKEIGLVEEEKLTQYIVELQQGKPLQYVLGYTWFKDLVFKVNENVLIPRPETEELVDWVLNEQGQEKLKVLDIGTGSGCIAITLAKQRPNWEIWGLDFSEKAIDIAVENAKYNKTNTQFKCASILENTTWEWIEAQNFDLIVSNPPYIPEADKTDMHKNVLDFEPHSALFVSNEQPLLFYQKMADNAKTMCYVEFAYNQERAMIDLLKSKNLKFEMRKDMSGNPRMCKWEYIK
jgi:release factor glutamine methyltransferase